MVPSVNTVGQVLRATRKERGLTLEQASAVTRVRLPYLQALENDEADLLPSVVQARGYLRLYADYLGLPVQPLLDAWPDRAPVIPSAPAPDEGIPPEILTEGEKQAKQADERIESRVEPPAVETETHLEEAPEEPSPEPLPEVPKTGSQAIFTQIGADLRQRRETISLSVEDVEQFTRLRAHYITALEEGRVDRLPSLVQGRGMLANYAEFLDMDVDELLSRFADALQARRLEMMVPARPDRGTRKQGETRAVRYPGWRRFLTPDLMIGGTLFILFFILVIWGAARVNEMSAGAVEPTPPSISEVLLNNDVIMDEPTPATTPEPTLSADAVINPPVQITNTPELTGLETLPPVGSNAPLQLSIIASQRTWVQVNVDGSVVFQGRTIPGNAYPFTGYDRIELICGNGSALTAVFNDQNLGALGKFGEVVRLIFSQEGMLTPTAQFTATPTVTLIPTNTSRPTQIPATPTVTPLIP
jgi:cytoskeletal protein RodZ